MFLPYCDNLLWEPADILSYQLMPQIPSIVKLQNYYHVVSYCFSLKCKCLKYSLNPLNPLKLLFLQPSVALIAKTNDSFFSHYWLWRLWHLYWKLLKYRISDFLYLPNFMLSTVPMWSNSFRSLVLTFEIMIPILTCSFYFAWIKKPRVKMFAMFN